MDKEHLEAKMVEFHFEEATHTLLCRFDGRMDTAMSATAAEKFNTEFSGLKAKAEFLKIIFDIKGVDYVASSFLRLSLIAAKGVARGHFSIINADPQVLKVYKIAGLSSLLNVS
jgi:anti-anti-sigma factor